MGDEVGVVHMPHGTVQHTIGEVQRAAGVAVEPHLCSLQDAILGAPHLVEGGGEGRRGRDRGRGGERGVGKALVIWW